MKIYDLGKKGNLSIYEYLYLCIKRDILSGELRCNEKLPSKRNLAKQYEVSVITIENAYSQLIMEGYIYAVEKKGYFVSNIDEIRVLNDISDKDINNSRIKFSEENISNAELEQKYLVDFTSNKVFYELFPFATWAKLMRHTLLDEESNFFNAPSPIGVYELREAILENLIKNKGIRANVNNIVIGAGTEYLYGVLVQLLGSNRMIAVEDPSHTKTYKIYENNGVKCLHIPVDEYGMSINELKGNNLSAIHICPSHQFPTGVIMPANRRHELINYCEENNSYIIEDDYDSEFRFSGRPIPPVASLNSEKVIYMNTFSRTLAPSIRIAYMVLPEALMEKYRKKLSFYSSTVSLFEQYTLARFIKNGYYERHINRTRNYYKEYRNRILEEIKKSDLYNKVSIEEENSGLHFILKINRDINDEDLSKKLELQRIRLLPISSYCYNNKKKFEHRFIINYSDIKEEDLKKALDIINRILESC